ncbi:MAG: pilus assembly PilX family protein [Gammaproteobacteria bacterium]
MKSSKFSVKSQRGTAALFTAVVLLIVATLMVLFAGKVGVQDMRISGNDSRYKTAFANAEAGIERMAAKIMADDSLTYPTSLKETGNPYYIVYATTAGDSVNLTGMGYADGYPPNDDGNAAVTQKYGFSNIWGGGPDAPLIVAGGAPPTGTMQIVGNPNGAGAGVVLSVWTEGDVDVSGTPDTCMEAEYLANGSPTLHANGIQLCAANSCNCTGTLDGAISSSSKGNGRDIVEQDPDFPDDLFEYMFKIPRALYTVVKGQADQVIQSSQCSSFNGDTHGFIWVEDDGTDCSLPTGNIGGNVGTVANGCGNFCTIVLVLEDVDLVMTGGNKNFFGVIYSFDAPGGGNGSVHMTGNNVVLGAMITDNTIDTSGISGTFDLRYVKEVFDEITAKSEDQVLSRVPGTWIDECNNALLPAGASC